MLLVASETVARAGAFPWHCSRLWVIKAGSELNCFLHFPQRKTSSSSEEATHGAMRKARASQGESSGEWGTTAENTAWLAKQVPSISHGLSGNVQSPTGTFTTKQFEIWRQHSDFIPKLRNTDSILTEFTREPPVGYAATPSHLCIHRSPRPASSQIKPHCKAHQL